jgi:hypothetical protein
MGKNPRLAFRYWLKGSDELRVQIYSLTNGYHRHLTLKGLSQGAWTECAVDMTAARRPDGSGGPLSENERIDDIQFYADPAADLIIDDIVLYDAALPDEKEPFPKRIVWTGWFDTGRQGKEWPGSFEIVAHEKPLTWKAAKSIDGKILLDLRGVRGLEGNGGLRFNYRLRGAEEFTLKMHGPVDTHTFFETDPARNRWARTMISFPSHGIDHIELRTEPSSEIWIDDVILYEPGEGR